MVQEIAMVSSRLSQIIFSLDNLICQPSQTMICFDRGIPRVEIDAFQKRLGIPNHLMHELPGGEEGKTREMKGSLEDWALRSHIGADSSVIAVGGGATLDLVGFFASTYGRGLPLFFIPSTLLAMADACFGGKCGVNVDGYKNMIGTIYHPHSILIQPSLLRSLPQHQMAMGLAEMGKHALLDSSEHLSCLLTAWKSCLSHDLPLLEQLIVQSLGVKERCIATASNRHLLNLGHTFAHALEALEGPRLSHGAAVSIGLYVEAFIGFQRGVVSQEVVDGTSEILCRVVSDRPFIEEWDCEALKRALAKDKKNIDGQPHVVWLQKIGQPYTLSGKYTIPLESSEIDDAYVLLRRFRGGRSC